MFASVHDFPNAEDEARIIALKVPELDERLQWQNVCFVSGRAS
jgi:hypothetical protein